MQQPEARARARRLLEDTLSERRCRHVFAVAEEMDALLKLYPLPETEAEEMYLAALLHDLTKEKSTEAQLQLCREYGIILRAEDERTEKALHAISGAEFARREFALSDGVCQAIRYHTTARADMTVCEKLLFLADYIEKTRTWAPCRALRRVFYRDVKAARSEQERMAALDRAVLLGLDSTLQDLIEQGRFIHPDTVEARNFLLAR